MNPEDTELLNSVLSKSLEELTPYDVEVLNARRGYLNSEQKKVFASVLRKDNEEETSQEVPAEEPKSKATPKKEIPVEEPAPEETPAKDTKEDEFNPYSGGNSDPDSK